MANQPGSFIWYELLTPDLDSAARFYQAVAGLTIQPRSEFGEMDYRMVSTPDGGFVGGAMQLTPGMSEHGMRPGWLGYVRVEDVDDSVARLQAAGGRLHMPPRDIPGVGRIAMVADPQGASFYLMRPAPPPGQENPTSTAFDPEKAGHVAWNELHAKDAPAALALYADLLGWEGSDGLDMGPMGTYQMFKVGGTDRAVGAMFNSPSPAAPVWLHYFSVPDIDAALARVEPEGGRLLHGPSEIPGGFFMFQGLDPQRALFAVVGPRKGD